VDIILNELSVGYIVLTAWVPPLITVLIGGIFASILFPRWQDRHARYHAREERKLALAEEIARDMARYTTCWSRLRTIAELEISREDGLTDEEFERKKGFVEARNSARDALMDTLCSLEIYFSSEVRSSIAEFVRWDEECSALRIDELPPREEYRNRSQRIVSKVSKEIAR
jgi:hypothetical protein